MKSGCTLLCFIFLCSVLSLTAQKENNKWYFPDYAAIDFSVSPPVPLPNGAMTIGEACASVSDKNGNLLFYTNSETIWNRNHAVMANGSGLAGHFSTTQGALIVKKPGSKLQYYVFSLGQMGTGQLHYSLVDMQFNGGLGAVTVKNQLASSVYATEKMTATRHANCRDVWVIIHDTPSDTFRVTLVSPSGVSTTPVLSGIGSRMDEGMYHNLGSMKVSPDGKKLAVILPGIPSGTVELFDFDNSQGTVSNPKVFEVYYRTPYGIAFSPDGSKIYVSCQQAGTGQSLVQYDACAATGSAIAASLYDVGAGGGMLQLGPDGKIYISLVGGPHLAAINKPNVQGAGCNYVQNAVTLTTATANAGLPNFYENSPIPAVSVATVSSCKSIAFTASNFSGILTGPCATTGYSATGVTWDFGEPSSGAANTSTLTAPTHSYGSAGTYTVSLAVSYSCAALNDTIRMVIPAGATNCTGAGDVQNDAPFRVFPNPAEHSLIIELPERSEVSILNIDGKQIRRFTLEPGVSQVDTGTLEPGMYLVNVHTRNFNKSWRITKIE